MRHHPQRHHSRYYPQRRGSSQWPPPLSDDTTIADDRTTTLPPPYQPKSYWRSHGKAPRWPLPGKSSSQIRQIHGSPYSRNPRMYEPKAAVAAPPGSLATSQPDKRVYDLVKRRLPRFHIIHVILLAGVGAMWLAITQPWGSDAAGAPIYIQQFSIPRISDPAVDIGQLALQTVSGIAIAAVIMAVALLMVNIIYTLLKKLLDRIGLSALAAMLFIPLVALLTLLLLADLALAAGFGGLSFLTQLPFVRDHGFASIGVANAAIGFYLWWIGIGATLIGTLGEIFIDRR